MSHHFEFFAMLESVRRIVQRLHLFISLTRFMCRFMRDHQNVKNMHRCKYTNLEITFYQSLFSKYIV